MIHDSINPYTVLRMAEEAKEAYERIDALRGQLEPILANACVHHVDLEIRDEVLGHIARGTASRPKDCARAALVAMGATEKIDFPRYCA